MHTVFCAKAYSCHQRAAYRNRSFCPGFIIEGSRDKTQGAPFIDYSFFNLLLFVNRSKGFGNAGEPDGEYCAGGFFA